MIKNILCVLSLLFLASFVLAQNDPVYNNTRISGVGNATAGQAAYFSLIMVDVNNRTTMICPNDNSMFAASLTGPNNILVQATFGHCQNGVIRVSWSSNAAGPYNLTVSTNGTGSTVVLGMYQVYVLAGPISPPQSTAAGNLTGGVVGQTFKFTITARDQYGNLNTACTPSYWSVVLTSGEVTVYGALQSTCPQPGTYVVTYSPTMKGSYSMVVRGNTYSIKGSPFTVEMTPASFSPSHSTVAGLSTSLQAGQISQPFTITSFDKYGNQINTCTSPDALEWNNTVQLNGQVQKPILPASPNCTAGVYYFQLPALTSASLNYQVVLLANSAPVSESPYALSILPSNNISVKYSKASGPGLTHGVAGLPSLVSINAYDVYNNMITNCDVTPPQSFVFQLVSSQVNCSGGRGQTCVEGNFQKGVPALFQGSWVCEKAIDYNLTIYYGTTPFPSTYHPSVQPGILSGPQSSADGPGTLTAIAGEISYVNVHPFDQYDNPIPDCTSDYFDPDNFTIKVTDNHGSSIDGSFLSCNASKSGVNMTLVYTLTSIFNTNLQITYNGQNLNPGSFEIITYPGPPAAGFCNSSGPGLVNSTAGKVAEFYVSCTDAYKNPITTCEPLTNWYFNLSYKTGGYPFVSGEPVSCDPKTAITTFEYTANKSGDYSLDYGYEGASLNDLHDVTVYPGPIDPQNTLATGLGVDGQNIPAGTNASFNVFARDSWNNSVEQCVYLNDTDGIAFKFSPNKTGQLSSLTATNCDPPNYNVTIYYKSTLATTYKIVATYGKKEISNSPYTPTWVAGPIDASKITAYGPGLYSATAGKSAYIYLNSTDIYNNPVTDCSSFNPQDWRLRLNYLNASNPLPVYVSYPNCSAGVVTTSYIAYTAGWYNISIEYQSNQISLTHRTTIVSAAGYNNSKSLVFGNGFDEKDHPIIAGVTETIYVLPRDSWGNNITTCPSGISFVASFYHSNQTNQYSSSNCDAASGYFPIHYSQKKAFVWKVVVNPTHLLTLNATSSITVYPASISPPHSYASQPAGYDHLVAGSPTTIQLKLYDEFDNNITDCSYSNNSLWNIRATLTSLPFNVTVAQPVTCTGNGHFTTIYTVGTYGTYRVTLTYGGAALTNSSYLSKFIAGDIDPAHSWAVGNGLLGQANVAGEWTWFKIYVANKYGIPITDGSLCVSISDFSEWKIHFNQTYSYNTTVLNANVSDCDEDEGYFYGEYWPTRAARYEVSVSLNNSVISMNPFHPVVIPGPVYPPNTVVFGINGTSGDNGTFYLQARDRYFNNESNVNSQSFNVTLSPTCAFTTINTWNDGGLVGVDWSVFEGGIYCVNVAYEGSYYPIVDANIHALGGVGCNSSCSLQGYCFRNLAPSTADTQYSCNCFQGYTGDVCDVKISSKYPLTTGAIVGLVIGIGILMFIIGLLIGFLLLRCFRRGDDHHNLLE